MRKRIFISFAIEDHITLRLFCGQAKNTRVPYEFVDMSVKQPWDTDWRAKCKARINSCSAMIVLVSENTRKASGAIYEIKCAKEKGIKILGIYVKGGNINNKPDELFGIKCMNWTWDNVRNFIDNL